jgi:integrase
LVLTALKGARRLLAGRGTKQADPLRLADMRSIVTALPIVAVSRPTMRRDQLLVALGWATALRASELVGLDVDDLNVIGDPSNGDGGLLVRVRNGKGADGAEWVAVPFSAQTLTCPVRRTIAYTRNIRSGAVFRHIDRHGNTHGRLGARPVSDVVRRAVTEAMQIDAAGYSAHSLRAGFVTEARSRGVPDELIARHTRHARPRQRRGGILNVYDRPTDLLERPALAPAWW